jgi:enoyl-[acyl-carrier protein] reductase I
LGNALPEALAAEAVHLLGPATGVTGDVRHVDGGYHVFG